MARSQIQDYLAVNKFLVLDVSLTLPPVLLPVFGFRSVSMPQLSVTYRQIKEGNYEFPKYAGVERAEVSNVTLEQGVSIINSDFYDWIRKAVTGNIPAKNLLIIQFHRAANDALKEQGGIAAIPATLFSAPVSLAGKLASGFNLEFISRLPGRGYLLKNCRPTSYRPGTDLNAESSEVSIASLELVVEEFDEFSYGI